MLNSSVFFIYLLSSFLIGGIVITLLTVISEKTNREFAGIIISIPSTIFLSFLFIGLSEGLYTIKKIIPSVPLALSNTLIFIGIYTIIGTKINSLSKAIIISSVGSTLVWISFSLMIVFINIHNLLVALLIYIFLVIMFTLFFVRNKVQDDPIEINQKISFREKIFRFIISGIIISLAVLFSKILDPLWGGLFSVFPAVYFSSLIIFHRRYGNNHLINFAESIPIGSLILLFFALCVYVSIEQLGLIVALIFSLLLSIVFSWILTKIFNWIIKYV